MAARPNYWPDEAEVAKPAPDGATWPRCGHPLTIANTQHCGKAGARCRICRRKISREGKARHGAPLSH